MQQKIIHAQIDPNGVCNAKCWFCPVAYEANPESGKKVMPIELFDDILGQICAHRGEIVSEDFRYIYTAHYNEVLMYPHFLKLLESLRKHSLGTMILSNGTPLTKNRIDMIREFSDVVLGLCLNMPAVEPKVWERFTGLPRRALEATLANIDYLHEKMPEFVERGDFSIQVNGFSQTSLSEGGGVADLSSKAPPFDLDEERGTLARQVGLMKARFPKTRVFGVNQLSDRAGMLERAGVMSNRRRIEAASGEGKRVVVGCNNMEGGRPEGWLHVNANGDVFLCCNDYRFEYLYGNLKEQSLKEIWTGPKRAETIRKAYGEICKSCINAVWGEAPTAGKYNSGPSFPPPPDLEHGIESDSCRK